MIEKFKLLLFWLLLLGATVFVSFFPAQTFLVKSAVLGTSLIVCSLIFYFSSFGKSVITFSQESWRECSKVFWPTRQETMQVVFVVVVFTVVVALYLLFVDKLLEWFLYDLILGWR